MKTERKMNWLCIYCNTLVKGSVTINIPSKSFVDPEGTYNCCNLYCDNCKSIVAHINVDEGIGKLIQLLNNNHFITDNSCEGHSIEHEIKDVEDSEIIYKGLDFRYPYFCIQDSNCVVFHGYYGRTPTLEMFKIFRDTGFSEIRFTYFSDIALESFTREEYKGSIENTTDEELAKIVYLYKNNHGRDLRISYSSDKTSIYYNTKMCTKIRGRYPSMETLKSFMTTYWKRKIGALYKKLDEYFATEKDVKIEKAPGVEDAIEKFKKLNKETQ